MSPQANILLLSTAAPTISPFWTTEKRFPIGIGFLASMLRRAGHRVQFIDNYLAPTGFPRGYKKLDQFDMIGISLNTICLADGLRMLKALQRLREKGAWKGKLVVGGPHTSLLPETLPQFVDHVVVGEGEYALLDILDGEAGRIVKAPHIKRLDDLPFPAYDLTRGRAYHDTVPWLPQYRVMNMNTSRGCPFRCAFCSVAGVWGRGYRTFSADRIVEEMAFLQRDFGMEAVYFREDNFTCVRRRVIDFCDKLSANGPRMAWLCESRVDSLDREMLRRMREAGCVGLYLGVESGSQRMLDLMQKDITLEQIRQVFAWCHGLGIRTYASFIVGLPGETEADRKATEELIERIQPSHHTYNVFVPLPGSRLHRSAIEQDLVAYRDPKGLLYLNGHDRLMKRYNAGQTEMLAPSKRRLVQVLAQRAVQRMRCSLRALLSRLVPGEIKAFIAKLLGKRRAA